MEIRGDEDTMKTEKVITQLFLTMNGRSQCIASTRCGHLLNSIRFQLNMELLNYLSALITRYVYGSVMIALNSSY
jgi:hypothetical protein